MTKFHYIFMLLGLLMFGCKNQLDVVNKNEPTLQEVETETGLINLATGVYGSDAVSGEGGLTSSPLHWYTIANHEAMGDIIYIPWGNFGWRWVNQVGEITLDNGTKIAPPAGGLQSSEIAARNTRALGNDNPTRHEWISSYLINNICNLILEKVETTTFSGDAETKKKVLKAWATFWKAYAYGRIGSMYSAGILIDEPFTVKSDFVSNVDMIAASNAKYDEALAIIASLASGGAYDETLGKIIPAMGTLNGNFPSPEAWTRNINSLKARNLLVNTKRADMTAAQWNEVKALATNGLQQGDFSFVVKQDDQSIISTLVNYRVLIGWHFPSERMIQDFKAGDARFTKYFSLRSSPAVNQSGRGIQYGTRYQFNDGTEVASTVAGQAPAYIGASWEENSLMLAEAEMLLGNTETGLGFVDAVRTAQGASLAATAGTGLNQTQALEELRKERRIALMLRGVSFYDARRWGVIDPVVNGGGRTGVVVLDASGNVNTNATFNYQYANYWPVPANELDFNAASAGSADTSIK